MFFCAQVSRSTQSLQSATLWCEKRLFLSHLCIKAIFLPRQARDKHRIGKVEKQGRFWQELEVAFGNLEGLWDAPYSTWHRFQFDECFIASEAGSKL